MTVSIESGRLRAFVISVLERCGLNAEAAATAADVVCYADLHGFTTHGSNALAGIYAPRLLDGRIDPAATPRVVREAGATALLDGGRGLGPVTMAAAVDLAARKAREHGVSAVAVRNSTHFGSAGYYTNRLARGGLVGIAMTNCGAQGVAPPLGGAVRMLGTNPLSAAAPAAGLAPFVLDMSTTVAATSKLQAARRAGRPVPVGWLIGQDGADVTDPAAYYERSAEVAWLGGRVETGGAKGYGLALFVDLLCGPLAGAAYGPRAEVLDGVGPSEDRDIGHFALALDPAAFTLADRFLDGAREILTTVEACPPAGYAGGVTYPGAPEARHAAQAEVTGVALPDAVAAELARLAQRLQLPVPDALRVGEAVATP
jgi:LDH2 family malate/lactate/ureidoglycolate dehydrogenase